MKLADSTIYNDNDLTIPTTPNSIICAGFSGGWSRKHFLIRTHAPIHSSHPWVFEEAGSTYSPEMLSDIVIIYRAPADGSTGPEMIEELHEKELEETLSKVEEFLTKTSKRVVNKVLNITRAMLEVE